MRIPGAAASSEEPGAWATSVLESMTLEEKAGQLLMPWMLGDFAPEGSEDYERIAQAVREDGVGGVIVSVGSPSEVAAKINNLQSLARYPLLVAADLESGAGYRMRGAVYLPNNIELGGATLFPSLMAGVHLPFAPVLDVNNNPQNPVISTRSFGEDPAAVARLGSAFVRGLQEHGAVATGKHFPGHGDTGVDSHVDLPVIRVDRERLARGGGGGPPAGGVSRAAGGFPRRRGGGEAPARLHPLAHRSRLDPEHALPGGALRTAARRYGLRRPDRHRRNEHGRDHAPLWRTGGGGAGA